MNEPRPAAAAPADRSGRAVLLVARSAFAAMPHREMRRIEALAADLPDIAKAVSCFAEQGSPSLREALLGLRDGPYSAILIVPLMLPMEPSFRTWLTTSLGRWQAEAAGTWPPVHLAPDITRSALFAPMLAGLVAGGAAEEQVPMASDATPPGSLVPGQRRRVLVCDGRACNSAGSGVVWGHLRNLQEQRKLRVTRDGTMTAKATCLGPCNLAPVLQVFPEGTYYGGVTEAAIDRIVEEHLLAGREVDEFAYRPTGRKQRLRPTSQPSATSSGE